jgi:hypothetical protein
MRHYASECVRIKNNMNLYIIYFILGMRQNASECVIMRHECVVDASECVKMRQNASNHAAVHSHVVLQNWYSRVHLGPHPVLLRVFA